MKIQKIIANEILDSRGNPTVEAVIILEDGTVAKAAVPSGASTGSREALELRDNDNDRFDGKGVIVACKNIEEKIFPEIKEIGVDKQQEIDEKMLKIDGTDNKESLGANAILAVSLAVCRVASLAKKIPLWQHIQETYNFKKPDTAKMPIPMMNVINGGAHSDSSLDLQEFMLVPSGVDSFTSRVRAASEIYHKLAKILQESGYRSAIGDEGGYAPKFQSNKEALEYILKAIDLAGYKLGDQVSTGVDAAASEFYGKEEGRYNLKLDSISIDATQLGAMYREWVGKFHLELIEDPFSESDWDGWVQFNKQSGSEISIIADDLTVTNENILKDAIERKACNAVLIKVNQIGSLSETINTIKLAKKQGLKIAVSHRSGETTDDFIADLAVAAGADYVKFGAPARGERVCKYNRIMEIEKSLGMSK